LAQLGGSYPAYYEAVLAGLMQAGARLVEEQEFIACRDEVDPTDKVVGFFTTDELSGHVYGAVAPENRWTFLVDTKVRDDGTGAYEGRLKYFERFSISHALLTYPIARDTKVLHDAGITTSFMPCCVGRARPRVDKCQGVVMAATFDERVYPTRTRLAKLFDEQLSDVAGVPIKKATKMYDVMGITPSNPEPPTKLAYVQMLDACQMGITCKSGVRDYLVAKYVEFGMCHVLPIGDCPSYMPDEMKRAMVDVEGMSDAGVVAEVRRLLAATGELKQRQDVYCDAVHRHYDTVTNAARVMDEVRTK
jgi:hypothetical protein